VPSRPVPAPIAVLLSLLWPLYIALTAIVVAVWMTAFSPAVVQDPAFAERVPNASLRAALVHILNALDPAWIVLGAINAYLALVLAEGLAAARRWSGMILLAGFGISAASAATSFPMGAVYFPANLGMKLGPVPFGLPFLWLAIVAGARNAVQWALPRMAHGVTAPLAGILCLLTIVNLDPLAWKYRAWWLWNPAQFDAPGHAPFANYLVWLVAGTGLAWLMRSPHILPRTARPSQRPMLVLAAINAVALATHTARALG
jgi:hypothetical protein